MKNILLFLFSTFFTLFSNAQSSELAWAKRIGGNTSATNNVYGPAITADEQGNSYMAGVFLNGNYNLDGITITKPAGTTSGGYIAKYNPNGQIVWAKPLGNIQIIADENSFNTNKIIVDMAGNIYFCGLNTTDAASVINNYYITPITSNTYGNYRAQFVAKLSPDGDVLWVKSTSITSKPEYRYLIKQSTNELFFDSEGNINMTGGFRDYITFGNDYQLDNGVETAGVYLAKYSPNGNVLSAKLLEGTYPESQYYYESVRPDASGWLYRWSSKAYGAENRRNLYIYDAQGEFIKSKLITMSSTTQITNADVYSNGFAVTPSGDVLIGGYWLGKTLTIEGQNYTGHSTNSDDQTESDTDGFILKLKSSVYTIDWVYLEKTTDGDKFQHLLSDGLGNIYGAGTFNGMFTPMKIKMCKLSATGVLLWQKIINSTDPNAVNKIRNISAMVQTQNGGNIWMSGYYEVQIYFDENHILTAPLNNSTNFYNGFLAKYGTCNTPNPIIETPESTEFCEGESLTLSANISNPALTYFWSTPTGNVPAEVSGSTATLSVTQPGKYALIAQENAECYGKSQEVWITQVPLPDNGIIQNSNTLTASASGEGITYQWLDCDNGNYPIEGATAQSYTAQTNGSYAVQVTNAKGCSAVSECKTVATLDVKDLQHDAVLLYPNPTESRLFLRTNENIKKISIINMQGQTLQTYRNTKELDVSALPKGLYILSAKTEKGNWRGKFLKK